MKMIIVFAFFCFASLSCHAQKARMFNSVDQYLTGAGGIWIVEDIGEINQRSGFTYQVKVLQSLKGNFMDQPMEVSVIFRKLIPGDRYLLFGFNFQPADGSSKGIWMDNGNVSPVPIPASFSLARLQGKPVKQAIELILSARSTEIADQVKDLTEEKSEIDHGLRIQMR
jgi:hypothetical protein